MPTKSRHCFAKCAHFERLALVANYLSDLYEWYYKSTKELEAPSLEKKKFDATIDAG